MTDVGMLAQYGALGAMVAYMMYDRQVIMKELISTLQSIRTEIADLRSSVAVLQERKDK